MRNQAGGKKQVRTKRKNQEGGSQQKEVSRRKTKDR